MLGLGTGRQGLRHRARCSRSARRCGASPPPPRSSPPCPSATPLVPVKGIGSTVKWDEAKADEALPDAARGQAAGPGTARRRRRRPTARWTWRRSRSGCRSTTARAPTGWAGRVDEALRATGFDTTRAPLNGGSREVRRTHVTYDPRWDRSARSLAAALPGCELRAVKGQGATLKVMAGPDYKGVTPVRAEDPHRGRVRRGHRATRSSARLTGPAPAEPQAARASGGCWSVPHALGGAPLPQLLDRAAAGEPVRAPDLGLLVAALVPLGLRYHGRYGAPRWA